MEVHVMDGSCRDGCRLCVDGYMDPVGLDEQTG